MYDLMHAGRESLVDAYTFLNHLVLKSVQLRKVILRSIVSSGHHFRSEEIHFENGLSQPARF